MKRHARALSLVALITALALSASPAAAHKEDALALDVLVNGQPLREIHARNATYIEAVRHAEYSLRLTNKTGSRMAVALAVDGLNTIDAKSGSASKASKWVLDPWETITIEGWQIGADNARKFFFTSEDKSYGAWLGKTSNLGVIEAVAYREVAPHPPRQPIYDREKKESGRMRSGESAAPQASGKAAPDPTESLSIRLRYEYRQQLVDLGVLPSPEEEQALARRERATGFDDFDFAPDPWGGN
jgi:hypothetical protein